MAVYANQDFQDYLVKQATDPLGAVVDVFVFAADTRRAIQRESFSWGVSYTDWMTSTDMWNMETSDQNMPLHMMMAFSIPLSFMPFAMLAGAPYFSIWTIGPAIVIDAFNIYRYFD